MKCGKVCVSRMFSFSASGGFTIYRDAQQKIRQEWDQQAKKVITFNVINGNS